MLMRGSLIAPFILLAVLPGLVLAQDPPPQVPEPIDGNMVEALEEEGEFDMLLQALDNAGLLQTLQVDEGPLTLFAPNDDAFDALPEAERQELMENPAQLQNVLAYHVVPAQALEAQELAQAGQAQSALGMPLEVQEDAGSLVVQNAEAEQTDLDAANGVIHVMDEVLMPPQDPAPPQEPPQPPEG